MSKDVYYFSHDSNARRDPKVLAMRNQYGVESYAWYWIIIEVLSEQKGYKLTHKDWAMYALAMEMQCDVDAAASFVNALVSDFELLESDGEWFWSESLLRRMEKKDENKKRRSASAKKAAKARWGNDADTSGFDENVEDDNATAMRTQCDSNANAMRFMPKESKVKESKGKESSVCKSPLAVAEDETHTPRTIDEILEDTLESLSRGLGISQQAFEDHLSQNRSIQANLHHKAALARWLLDKRAKLYAKPMYLQAVANDVFTPDKKQKVKRIASEPLDYDLNKLTCPECGERLSEDELMVKDSDEGLYRTIHTESHFGFTYVVARATEITFCCRNHECARANGYSYLEKEASYV